MDLDKQRFAMKKLEFLVGDWEGEAWLLRGPGLSVDMIQTEKAEYRLDGLLLTVEGVGRAKADNSPVLQALGVISYDDTTETYTMRAFNDGRFLETEIRLLPDGEGLTWGFTFGEYRTSTVLRIDEKGQWTELAHITVSGQGPFKLMELAVSRR
jgi:hypothetical protein